MKFSESLTAATESMKTTMETIKKEIQEKMENAAKRNLSGSTLIRVGADEFAFALEPEAMSHAAMYTNEPVSMIQDLLDQVLDTFCDDQVTATGTFKDDLTITVKVTVVPKK
jgi:hypothetical protein